ncbi:threonine-phosphate decarboxylase CobD [Bacillus sp. FJAT-42315]|uniref:threonine-phosphate decarboxylase CobD n=1 Tax=Bacillus sp. FJAT-42315 TaxID=2014077 RepID=UPI000C23DB62|nr:threonine-phosphate decarboxylase CobD [Bacillus sp. FJAT-42315]
MNLPAHGANPAHLYEKMNVASPAKIIDFSVNTNPYGPPPSLKEKWSEWFSAVSDYPDPEGRSLTQLLASQNGVKTGQVLLGNGAAEVIQFLGQLLQGERVVIGQPAFSEYETACRVYQCDVDFVAMDEGVERIVEVAKEASALFICTPNNPTGLVFQPDDLLYILDQLKESSCLVIVDEAFYDFAGDFTYATYLANYPQLVILRSLTKMYAIAGLRIGYALASETIIERLARFRPQWNVNALALLAAETALQDASFVETSRQLIEEERKQMFEFLDKEGFDFTRSVVNFYLLRDPRLLDQRPLLEFLLKKGLVLRHTYNYPTLNGRWLRVAVKTKEENDQLKEALLAWKQHS